MASTDILPKRGDVWLVSLGAARPGEPGKNRPAVIVSSSSLVRESPTTLITVVPLTTSRTPSPTVPVVPAGNGVATESRAACDAVRSLSKARLLERYGHLDPQTMKTIEQSLALVLELNL
jgi:mRNA interferase MazF